MSTAPNEVAGALLIYAGMVEVEDAADSKSAGSDTVWVQVPLPAPYHKQVI